MNPSALSIRDLRIKAGRSVVLGISNLDLPLNRTTVVLGPGGSGKSTLLRSLGGVPFGDGLVASGVLIGRPQPIAVLDQRQNRLLPPSRRAETIARLVGECPGLMLLDEPDANCSEGELADVVAAIALADHVTVVVATHHLGLARRLAHHLVMLLDGRVLGAGSAPDLFANPPSPRARDLLVWGS